MRISSITLTYLYLQQGWRGENIFVYHSSWCQKIHLQQLVHVSPRAFILFDFSMLMLYPLFTTTFLILIIEEVWNRERFFKNQIVGNFVQNSVGVQKWQLKRTANSKAKQRQSSELLGKFHLFEKRKALSAQQPQSTLLISLTFTSLYDHQFCFY